MKNLKMAGLAVCLAAAVSWPSAGQEAPASWNGKPERISLEEAIRIGMENNPSYRITEIGVMENEKGLKEGIAGKLPHLTLQAGAQRNFLIGVTPIPAKMMNPGAPDGEIYLARFGTDHSGIAGITLQFDLFNPDRYGSVARQKILLALSGAERQDRKELIISNICLDYSAAAIAMEQLDLCRADTLNSRKYLDYVAAGREEGRFSEDDCLRARQNLGISKALLLQAESICLNSKSRLLADLGMDVKEAEPDKYVIEDRIEALVAMCRQSGPGEFPLAERFSTGDAARIRDRLELELKRQEIKCGLAGFFPTLSLHGYYGGNFFDHRFRPFDAGCWHGNAYLGLKVTCPLTVLSGQTFKMQKARLTLRKTEWEQEEERQQRNLQIASCNTEVDNYGKEIDLRRSNLELALRRIEIAGAREAEGGMRPDQMEDSIYRMRECRVEYLQCLYHYFTALVNRRMAEI